MKFLFDHDVPDDMAFALEALGHPVLRVRQVLAITSSDQEILQYASRNGHVLITCNRDDFIEASKHTQHAGIIILIRRRARAMERASLVRLLDKAGETGVQNNINFA